MSDRMPIVLSGNRGRKPRWDRLRVTKVGTALITVVPNVTRQTLANPHISEDGTLMLAYGTEDASPQTVGDRIYAVDLGLSSLRENAPTISAAPRGSVGSTPAGPPITTALAYPPVLPQCVDHLGAGATLAIGPDGRFYALTVVSDAANKRAWIAWAVKGPSGGWLFTNDGGNTPPGLYWASNPLLSTAIIRRADWAWQLDNGQDHWHHLAMRWDAREQNFLACVGYAGLAGLCATWWRIEFDANSPSGLGEVRRAVTGGGGVVENEDLWAQANAWMGFSVAADPMEIVSVNDGFVFFYAPVDGVYARPTRVCYVRCGTTPPALPQVLDLSLVYEKWGAGNELTPGGNYLTAYQSGPTTLTGYVAVSPKTGDENGRQGLVSFECELVP